VDHLFRINDLAGILEHLRLILKILIHIQMDREKLDAAPVADESICKEPESTIEEKAANDSEA